MQNPEAHPDLLSQVINMHIQVRKHLPWEYSDLQKTFTKYLQNWYLTLIFLPNLKFLSPLGCSVLMCWAS